MLFLHLLVAFLPAALAWNTYVVPHVNGADDTPALTAALATGTYSNNATILFKKGVYYNIWTPIKFPSFQNVEVRIEGNLSYPTDVATIQGVVDWPWLSLDTEQFLSAIVASSVRS